jgi:hypothetical protein
MDQTTASADAADSDEISLLDLPLSMAEYWRTLLLVPVAAGVLALAISFLIPRLLVEV